MPAVRDQELNVLGITPKAHVLRKCGKERIRWPFKAMVLNDFFVVELDMVPKVKNALKSFNKRIANRRFSVRPQAGSDTTYVVRRVV